MLAGLMAAILSAGPAANHASAQLRGHGGPVRAVAGLADGRSALSGGFDQSAILWDIDAGAARAVLRFHEGAVNAVAALPYRRLVHRGDPGAHLYRLARGEGAYEALGSGEVDLGWARTHHDL